MFDSNVNVARLLVDSPGFESSDIQMSVWTQNSGFVLLT
jgi:hypothetical protein